MTPALFCRMAQDMLPLLNAQEGDMSAAFPYFLSKKAPISGAQSLLDYDLAWTVHVDAQAVRFELSVQVPLTSLCPCSKAIYEYGAHNQRSMSLSWRGSRPSSGSISMVLSGPASGRQMGGGAGWVRVGKRV